MNNTEKTSVHDNVHCWESYRSYREEPQVNEEPKTKRARRGPKPVNTVENGATGTRPYKRDYYDTFNADPQESSYED